MMANRGMGVHSVETLVSITADGTPLLPHQQSCMNFAELRLLFTPPSLLGTDIHKLIQAMLDETLVRRGSVAAFVEVCSATSPPSGIYFKHSGAVCFPRLCVHSWSFPARLLSARNTELLRLQ